MKREYHLTDEGGERLRAAIARRKPWTKSTGPKTAAGKARSGQNACKHGARSRATVAVVRLGQAMLRVDAIRAGACPESGPPDGDAESVLAAVKEALAEARDHAEDLVRAGDVKLVGALFLEWFRDSDFHWTLDAFYSVSLGAVSEAATAGHWGAMRLMMRIIDGDLSGLRTRARRAGQTGSA